MNNLLIDVGSTIPNLALMQLSSWLKSKREHVSLQVVDPETLPPFLGKIVTSKGLTTPDRAWISCVFTWHRATAMGLAARFEAQGSEVHVGGTGIDLVTRLPIEAQDFPPDYELYDDDRALGFSVRGCNRKCGFCLTPETLVMTGGGPKPIRDITLGDTVLTHQGRYRPVTHVFMRHYSGQVYSLRSEALSALFETTITPEHPVLMRHVSYRSGGQRLTSFGWRNGETIQPGHQHRSRDVYAYPRAKESDSPKLAPGSDLPLTEDLMTLIGWYLAEGYISHTEKRGWHRTTFCLGHNDKEQSHSDKIVSAAHNLGINARSYHPKIGIRVAVDNVAFSRWLVREFGTGSSVKGIPLWVRQLPAGLLEPLLRAYLNGDGWEYKRHGNLEWRAATVSYRLALSLREVALKLGYLCHINTHVTNDMIQGRKVNVKPAWAIILRKPRHVLRSVLTDANYIYWRAEPSVVRFYDGPVHNLEVAEDNSYCTPTFALHNCVVPNKEGKIDVETYRPLRSWVPADRKKVLLLDNNLAQSPFHDDVLRETKELGLKLSITQGYDIRLMTPERAAMLADWKPWDLKFHERRLYIAWDYLGIEGSVRRGIQMLIDAGFKGRDIMTYILCGFNSSLEEDIYRFKVLREFGVLPFVMRYQNRHNDPWLNAFSRWVNRMIYKSCSWEDYDRRPDKPKKTRKRIAS